MFRLIAMIWIPIIFIFLSNPAYSNQEPDSGLKAFNSKNYTIAFSEWKKSAENGNPVSQYNIGYLYENGLGIKQDYSEAIKWYRKSAEQKYSDGQLNLGAMYYFGKGVTQDYLEASQWYRKAAEQGNAIAQSNLGNLYENGNGLKQDYREASIWYLKAAKQGNINAQINLGLLYETGNGVKQNFSEAIFWYRKAAEQGNSIAQANMGYMILNGKVIKQDYGDAIVWFTKSAAQNNSNGQNGLGLLHEYGKGVNQNYAEAFNWYRKSAEQGNAAAQTNIGILYEHGRGVAKNNQEAIKWYRLAAKQGNEDAKLLLTKILGKDEVDSIRNKYIKSIDADIEKKDFTNALKLTQNCIDEYGDICELYRYSGWLKLKLKDNDGAYKDFTLSIDKKEKNYESSYLYRSRTYKPVVVHDDFLDFDKSIQIDIINRKNEQEYKNKVLSDIRMATKISPLYTNAWWELAYELNHNILIGNYTDKNRDLTEAISVFEKIIELDSKYDVRVYRFKAYSHMQFDTPQCEQALRDRHVAIEFDKTTDLDFKLLAENYVDCGNYSQAIKEYENILSQKKSFFSSNSSKYYKFALAKTWFAWSGISITQLSDYDFLDYDSRTIKKSLSIFDQIIKENNIKGTPVKDNFYDTRQNSLIYFYKGIIHALLKENKQASDSLLKSNSINPHSTIKFHLARALVQQNKYSEALKYCNESITNRFNWKDPDYGTIVCSEEMVDGLNKIVLLGSSKDSRKKLK